MLQYLSFCFSTSIHFILLVQFQNPVWQFLSCGLYAEDRKNSLTVKLNSTGLPISLVDFTADSPTTLPLNSVLKWEGDLQKKKNEL